MSFYKLHEEDRQFLYALLYATGIILFWRGVWEASARLPLLNNIYFSLFVGLLILTLTGYMYREFDPLASRLRKIGKLVHDAVNLAKRGQAHHISYYDELGKHDHKLHAHSVKKVEHDFLIVEENGHERFIPLSRITKIHKGNEVIWRR